MSSDENSERFSCMFQTSPSKEKDESKLEDNPEVKPDQKEDEGQDTKAADPKEAEQPSTDQPSTDQEPKASDSQNSTSQVAEPAMPSQFDSQVKHFTERHAKDLVKGTANLSSKMAGEVRE